MKVIQAIPQIGNNMGGVVSVIANSVPELKRLGVETVVVGQIWPGEDPANSALTPLDHHYVLTKDTSGYGVSLELVRDLKRLAKTSDIVHCHGLWMFTNYATYAAAKSARKPYIVTVHGMAEPWILSRSQAKKKAVDNLFQMQSLQTAACVHAICEPELTSIRNYGVKAPIAVIPNGVNPAHFENLPARDAFEGGFPSLQGKKRLLFMARLHPKKGVIPLLGAWKIVAQDFPDWQLVIAGPDEKGHQAEVEAKISEEQLGESVTLTGMVSGERKREALASADAFILPSFSEVLGISVMEAMVCGVPVILTPGCNFPEVAQARAGFEVPPTPDDLAGAIRSMLCASDQDRAAMGARGRELILSTYTWAKVAAQFKQLYEWTVGGGEPPSFVRMP